MRIDLNLFKLFVEPVSLLLEDKRSETSIKEDNQTSTLLSIAIEKLYSVSRLGKCYPLKDKLKKKKKSRYTCKVNVHLTLMSISLAVSNFIFQSIVFAKFERFKL